MNDELGCYEAVDSSFTRFGKEGVRALWESGGMLGFNLYPFHLKNGPNCKLEDFCSTAHETADLMGIDRIEIGSDPFRHWDGSTLEWMRGGRWAIDPDFSEGSSAKLEWPGQPSWIETACDIMNIASGLGDSHFTGSVAAKMIEGKRDGFFDKPFGSLTATQS